MLHKLITRGAALSAALTVAASATALVILPFAPTKATGTPSPAVVIETTLSTFCVSLGDDPTCIRHDVVPVYSTRAVR